MRQWTRLSKFIGGRPARSMARQRMAYKQRYDSVLTVREVARFLNIHTNTVRRWSDLGILKGYRIGPRGDRRFRQEDVYAFLPREDKNGRGED